MSTKAGSVMPQPPSHGRPSARCPLQTQGNAVISQDGREAAMSPGNFAVYDSIRPYTLRFDDDSQKIMLKLRGDPLRDEVDSLAPASAGAVASGVVNVLVAEVAWVATELGMSVDHWHRLFKSEPRLPSQDLWNRGLQACSRELPDSRRGRAAVAEIAFAWSFNDAAQSSRAFCQRFHASPRKGRRHGVVSA